MLLEEIETSRGQYTDPPTTLGHWPTGEHSETGFGARLRTIELQFELDSADFPSTTAPTVGFEEIKPIHCSGAQVSHVGPS